MAVEFRKERQKWGFRVTLDGKRIKQYRWDNKKDAEEAYSEFLNEKAKGSRGFKEIQTQLLVELRKKYHTVALEEPIRDYGRCDIVIIGMQRNISHLIEIKTADPFEGIRRLLLFGLAKRQAQKILVVPNDMKTDNLREACAKGNIHLWVWGPGATLGAILGATNTHKGPQKARFQHVETKNHTAK